MKKKLIRDNIPEIASAQGRTLKIEVASDAMLSVMVRHKLEEELEEVLTAQTREQKIEELADLLEVIEKYLQVTGITQSQVQEAREKKNLKNGAFTKNLILTTE